MAKQQRSVTMPDPPVDDVLEPQVVPPQRTEAMQRTMQKRRLVMVIQHELGGMTPDDAADAIADVLVGIALHMAMLHKERLAYLRDVSVMACEKLITEVNRRRREGGTLRGG